MSKKNNGNHINKSKFGVSEYVSIFVCVLIGIAMIIVAIFWDKQKTSNGTEESDDYYVVDLRSSEGEVFSSEEIESEAEEDGLPYEIIEVDTSGVGVGELVLVNKDHEYTFKDETEIVEVYENKSQKYKLGTGDEKLYFKTIQAANEFLGDFYDVTGKKNATLVNGYFSFDEQQKKYESYIKSATPEDAQKWGVKAGFSDHHTALSFNLMLYPSDGVIGEGDYAWITENAHKYGFILRYPTDKSEITLVKDDNHFRYVGIPHAEYMYKNNLVLEEYIEALEKTTYSNPLKFQSGNKEYMIYFIPADSSSQVTEIKVPKGYSYTCSGDNANGFIITAYLS